MMFEALWQRLTLAQRAVLRAVVLEEGRELLSADVRARHRLGGPSTVQAALAALVRDDVISRERRPLRRRRLAAARVGRAADVLVVRVVQRDATTKTRRHEEGDVFFRAFALSWLHMAACATSSS